MMGRRWVCNRYLGLKCLVSFWLDNKKECKLNCVNFIFKGQIKLTWLVIIFRSVISHFNFVRAVWIYPNMQERELECKLEILSLISFKILFAAKHATFIFAVPVENQCDEVTLDFQGR